VLNLLHRHHLVEALSAQTGDDPVHPKRAESPAEPPGAAAQALRAANLPMWLQFLSRCVLEGAALTALATGQADQDGDILLEYLDAVRETLIADMNNQEILAQLPAGRG